MVKNKGYSVSKSNERVITLGELDSAVIFRHDGKVEFNVSQSDDIKGYACDSLYQCARVRMLYDSPIALALIDKLIEEVE